MPIKYPPGSGGGSVGPNLTLAGNLIVQGNTTLGDGVGDDVNIYGIITFTNGGAITNGNHEYGRLAAGGLQGNVPVGNHHYFSVDGTTILDVFEFGCHITIGDQDGVAPVDFKVVTGAHTNIPASTASPSLWFDMSATKTWDAGNFGFQGDVFFDRATYAFDGASTVTSATTIYVQGPPLAGNNAAFLFTSSMTIDGGTGNKNSVFSLILTPPQLADGVGNVGQLSCLFIGSTGGGVSLGNQTATLTKLSMVDIGGSTFFSTTNTRTVTNASALTLNPPIEGALTTFTNVFSLYVESGASRFDGRVLGQQGVGLVAANDLSLGEDGQYWTVSGNTQINAIETDGWTSGSIVVLKFLNAPLVKHSTAGGAGFASLILAGSVDFAAASGDTLMLMYDGTVWQELCRKVI